MPVVQLKKKLNYFISSDGIVFKIENGNEVRLRTFRGKRNKRVYVEIDKIHKELVYLMMEYFEIKYTPYDKLYYTITDDLRIPLGGIRVKKFLSKTNLSEEDERFLYKFKCDFKANSANARAPEQITSVQVFEVIRLYNFRCVYCNRELFPETWHLDHFTPLSKGGKNIFENLVASCNDCNIMKGAMDGNQFYVHCVNISKNCIFSGKDVLVIFNNRFEKDKVV
jgi:hypothetical protein